MNNLVYAIEAIDGLLVVLATGVFNAHEFFALWDALAMKSAETGIARAVVDIRGVLPPRSEFDRFSVGAYAAQLFGHRAKIALLSPAEHENGLIENAAVNRGGILRVFGNSEEAHAWLAEEDGPEFPSP